MPRQRTESSKLLESDSLDNDSVDGEPVPAGCSPAFCQFPCAVYFIMAQEFCERFNYFGVRSVLTLYLMHFLLLGADTATLLYHLFVVLCYLSPLLGGIIADGLLGRFYTILVLSVVYCIGGLVVAATAVPGAGLVGALCGLLLVAMGTGGIKPNVSAFGADQLPEGNGRLRDAYFSTFYFFINLGSLLATVVIPVVRSRVQCMGHDCYALAFGIPAGAMALALAVFAAGRPLYQLASPTSSVVARSIKCLFSAVGNYWRADVRDADKKLLDYADPQKYSPEFIAELRQFKRLLVLYIPFPFFWSLFDQIGSRWTIQATYMDGYVGSGFSILPDQMQGLNSLLILFCIPVFDCFVYPLFAKAKLPLSLLKRIGLGMLMTSAAFVAAMVVQLQVEADVAVVPARSQMKVKLVNALVDCDARIRLEDERYELSALSFSAGILLPRSPELNVVAESDSFGCDFRVRRNLTTPRLNSSMDIFLFDGVSSRKLGLAPAALKRRLKGKGMLRLLLAPRVRDDPRLRGDPVLLLLRTSRELVNATFRLADAAGGPLEEAAATHYVAVRSGFYTAHMRNTSMPAHLPTIGIRDGQIITMVMTKNKRGDLVLVVVEDVRANSVSMLWQVPQYILITVGEVLFSVSGLALSYAEAPASMKSLVQALWLMCVGLGNIVVMAVSKAKLLPRQSSEFLMFALLMLVNFALFVALGLQYRTMTEREERLLKQQQQQQQQQQLQEQLHQLQGQLQEKQQQQQQQQP